LLTLFQFFVELCLLRRAPQDLPASAALFGAAFAADLLVGILVAVAGGLSPGSALVQGLTQILFMLVLLYGALQATNRTARFAQAATALLGTGALLGALALFPVSLVPQVEQAEQVEIPALAALMLLTLLVWSVLVMAHILRHTFEIRAGQGVAVAILYNMLAFAVLRGVFTSP
jgi:hypothetical protein